MAQGPAFQEGQPSAALSQYLQIRWAVLSHPSSPADSGNAKPVPQERGMQRICVRRFSPDGNNFFLPSGAMRGDKRVRLSSLPTTVTVVKVSWASSSSEGRNDEILFGDKGAARDRRSCGSEKAPTGGMPDMVLLSRHKPTTHDLETH